MSGIEIKLLDAKRCSAHHTESGAELITDVTPQFGGGGTSFSSTDLVGVALGTCIGSSIAPLAEREQIPFEEIRISVQKSLEMSPRRIGKLAVSIALPSGLTDVQRKKLENAAATCAVHRSIESGIEIEVTFVVAESDVTP